MNPPTFVAEIGANVSQHSLEYALKTVAEAARAGADAIKLQTWTPGTMCINDAVVPSGPWAGKRLQDLYADCWTPWDWHRPIFDYARKLGLDAWSTPFDRQAVDFLQTIDCSRHKIASFEILDLDLIRYCADTGRPLIISTGMATDLEITAAVKAAFEIDPDADVTLLHCVSEYPAPIEQADVGRMRRLKWYWKARMGLSDHTMGHAAAAAATALGASMIEKHFTLSRLDRSPDAGFSMEPQEFAQMVRVCRDVAACMSNPVTLPELTHRPLRRGIYWAADLPAGHVVTAHDMVTARPSTPLTPEQAKSIIGKTLEVQVRRGAPI